MRHHGVARLSFCHVNTKLALARVCRSERLQYGTEIDIWSVGCICAEMLLSAPVFLYEQEIPLINAIVRGLGVPDPEIWPEVTKLQSWESVVKKQERSDLEQSLYNRVCHRRPVRCFSTPLHVWPPHEAEVFTRLSRETHL